MLIEPASKVSVPLTVVIRTAVSAAPRAIEPAELIKILAPLLVMATLPDATQVFPVTFEMTIAPESTSTAAILYKPNPVVTFNEDSPEEKILVPLRYPVVVYVVEPVPNWICLMDVPDVLTPLSITVMRFTSAEMPVKSITVPLVEF